MQFYNSVGDNINIGNMNTIGSGGYDNNSGGNYTNVYERGLRISLYPVSNIEIAEITKIAENAYRYLQIAFAEDLYLYCQANDINFQELREALNTKWNVNILEPRDGIGGHCLPKDTKMFLESSISSRKSKILSAAIEVDQDYWRHLQARSVVIQKLHHKIEEDKIKSIINQGI